MLSHRIYQHHKVEFGFEFILNKLAIFYPLTVSKATQQSVPLTHETLKSRGASLYTQQNDFSSGQISEASKQ